MVGSCNDRYNTRRLHSPGHFARGLVFSSYDSSSVGSVSITVHNLARSWVYSLPSKFLWPRTQIRVMLRRFKALVRVVKQLLTRQDLMIAVWLSEAIATLRIFPDAWSRIHNLQFFQCIVHWFFYSAPNLLKHCYWQITVGLWYIKNDDNQI